MRCISSWVSLAWFLLPYKMSHTTHGHTLLITEPTPLSIPLYILFCVWQIATGVDVADTRQSDIIGSKQIVNSYNVAIEAIHPPVLIFCHCVNMHFDSVRVVFKKRSAWHLSLTKAFGALFLIIIMRLFRMIFEYVAYWKLHLVKLNFIRGEDRSLTCKYLCGES